MRLVECRSIYPVMPTQVGIHVFPRRDQQDVDGVARFPGQARGHEPRHDAVGINRAVCGAVIQRRVTNRSSP
jgi:hypothetical protein